MKKLFLHLILSTCITGICLAQAPVIGWEKNLGGTDWDIAQDVIQVEDGGYLIAGGSQSNDFDVSGNYGNWDYWLVKLDLTGTIEWENHYGGSGSEVAFSVLQTLNNHYVLAGYSQSADHDLSKNNGEGDYWVIKLDESGGILWERNYGGTGYDRAKSICQTNDGGFIIAGESESDNLDVSGNHGGYDYWVIKIDSVGTIEWEKNYGGSGDDKAQSILQTDDGGYIIAGVTNSNDFDISLSYGGEDFWVVKLDSIGQIEWEKVYGGSANDFAHAIDNLPNGGYIIAGESKSVDHDVTNNYGNGDFWLIKIDTLGNLQWESNYGGSEYDAAFSVSNTADGGYITAGISGSSDHDVSGNYRMADYWVVKLNESGVIEWEKNLGGKGFEVANKVIQTEDGSFIIAGYSDEADNDVSNNNGTNDFWVVKLGETSVNVPGFESESEIVLYPNPFSRKVSIDLGENYSDVAVKVINNLGQNAGTYQFGNSRVLCFEIEGPSGLYIIQVYPSNNLGQNERMSTLRLKAFKTE